MAAGMSDMDAFDQAVNRLKNDAFIVNINDLHQCVAGGVVGISISLGLIPDGFRGCQGMIAIADGKKEG